MQASNESAVVQVLLRHWAKPAVEDGRPVIVDCADELCGFQSNHADAVGEQTIWTEHARHVAELLEQAGIAEIAGVRDAERLRLADKLDEEAKVRGAQRWLGWSSETNLGWIQAANHLRHPTATK